MSRPPALPEREPTGRSPPPRKARAAGRDRPRLRPRGDVARTPTAPTPPTGATICAGAPARASTSGRSPTPNASASISRRSPPAPRAQAAGRGPSPRSSGGSRRSSGISPRGPCPSTARTAMSRPCSPASAAPMAGRRCRRRRSCRSMSWPCSTPCPRRSHGTCATGRSSCSASPAACAARKSPASS